MEDADRNHLPPDEITMAIEGQSRLKAGEVEDNLTSNDVDILDIDDFSDSMESSSPPPLVSTLTARKPTPRNPRHSATAPEDTPNTRVSSTPNADPTTDKSTAGTLRK